MEQWRSCFLGVGRQSEYSQKPPLTEINAQKFVEFPFWGGGGLNNLKFSLLRTLDSVVTGDRVTRHLSLCLWQGPPLQILESRVLRPESYVPPSRSGSQQCLMSSPIQSISPIAVAQDVTSNWPISGQLFSSCCTRAHVGEWDCKGLTHLVRRNLRSLNAETTVFVIAKN
jgi:hypothetical protein